MKGSQAEREQVQRDLDGSEITLCWWCETEKHHVNSYACITCNLKKYLFSFSFGWIIQELTILDSIEMMGSVDMLGLGETLLTLVAVTATLHSEQT